MTTQSVILTALPNGFGADKWLKVTVFVTPRLSTDGPDDLKLKEFEAFRDWPATAAALFEAGLVVHMESHGDLTTLPDPEAPAADSAMWKQLLDENKVGVHASSPPPGNPGGGFRDLSTRVVRSFPTGLVASQILGLYKDVATTSPTSFPPVTSGPLAGLAGRLGDLSRNPGQYYGELDGILAEEVGPDDKRGRYVDTSGLSASTQELLAFVQALRFYDRPGERDPAGPTAFPDPPKTPPIDFHNIVAFLGDYPFLLRPLGLAIDLLAEPPALSDGEMGRIRVAFLQDVPEGLEFVGGEDARPWTNFEVRDERFIARPRNPEGDLVDGTLRLEAQDWFSVNQVDVDGSALKTIDFAANVAQIASLIAGGQPSMTPDDASVPALRTGGFVISRANRAEQVVGQFDQAVEHEKDRTGGTPADLFAEDVTRGYRPDVCYAGSGDWFSLTLRDGTYAVELNGSSTPLNLSPDEPGAPVCRDEAFVKGASTTSVAGETDAELYLHEVLFGWDGWSLASKRPGNAIVDAVGAVGQPQSAPPEEFPLATRFKATAGTLPRLRFAHEYRFRVRAVDLAGNSVPEKYLDPSHQTDVEVFLRFDPVPSPAVVPRRQFGEGESLLRMVIRSTLGVLPAPYIALPRIVALNGHTTSATAYLDRNERHIAAPKSSVQLAEWHGMFDTAMGVTVAQEAINDAYDVAAREAGSFIDDGPGAAVANPASPADATDLASHLKGQPLKAGEYVIRDIDKLVLPYLPDPAAAGPAFTSLPGGGPTTTFVWPRDHVPPNLAPWWDRQPIRIRIEDGGPTNATQQAPKWVPAERLLRVFLRQAEMVTVRLGCQPTPEGAVASGILDLLDPGVRTAQWTDVIEGRHWMVTPFQNLTLVHAVEMPLAAPVVDVDDAGVTRNEGETYAVLQGEIDNHAKSTGRLDIDAIWFEPIDDPGKDAPNDVDHEGEIEGQAHVGDFLLEATEDACKIGRDDVPAGINPAVHKVRHEFRDTKHRRVTYKATATTRFREYFPTDITSKPSLITHVGPTTTTSVPSSRRPDPPDVEYVIPTFRWVDETYRGLPAGLTEADVAPRLARAIKEVRGGSRLLERGFRAERVALPPGVRLPLVRRRLRKCGLRVYLGRPWYSSGAEELLAVVVPDQPYITWPIDIDRGLVVEGVARALADESAERILGRGLIRGTGARAAASERLVRSVQKLQPAADSLAEATADPDALLSLYQGEQLEDLLDIIGPFLPVGDPETYVTRYGNDPIWGSDPVADGPWIHQFPLRTRVGTGLSLAEVPFRTVAAIGHRPQFDTDRKLWYCDIDIDAGTSYFPFVRLGLARYQPNSIPGVHLSRVVTPEWAQILPTRAATISRPQPGKARVTLRGPAGYNAVAREVLGSAAGSGPDGMALSRFAVAQVERLPAGATTDLAWRPAGDEVKLGLELRSAWSDIEYSGWLPVPSAAEGEQLRVTIREYEIFQTDLSQADDVVKHTTVETQGIDFGQFGSFDQIVIKPDDRPVRFRLAYADRFHL